MCVCVRACGIAPFADVWEVPDLPSGLWRKWRIRAQVTVITTPRLLDCGHVTSRNAIFISNGYSGQKVVNLWSKISYLLSPTPHTGTCAMMTLRIKQQPINLHTDLVLEMLEVHGFCVGSAIILWRIFRNWKLRLPRKIFKWSQLCTVTLMETRLLLACLRGNRLFRVYSC